MTNCITVSPVYGRDYKGVHAAKADWFAGKDFVLESTSDGPHFGGRYCSKRDFADDEVINIYFNKKRQFTIIK